MRFLKADSYIALLPCINFIEWGNCYTIEIGWIKYWINITINKTK